MLKRVMSALVVSGVLLSGAAFAADTVSGQSQTPVQPQVQAQTPTTPAPVAKQANETSKAVDATKTAETNKAVEANKKVTHETKSVKHHAVKAEKMKTETEKTN